jgi:hypothetical protein
VLRHCPIAPGPKGPEAAVRVAGYLAGPRPAHLLRRPERRRDASAALSRDATVDHPTLRRSTLAPVVTRHRVRRRRTSPTRDPSRSGLARLHHDVGSAFGSLGGGGWSTRLGSDRKIAVSASVHPESRAHPGDAARARRDTGNGGGSRARTRTLLCRTAGTCLTPRHPAPVSADRAAVRFSGRRRYPACSADGTSSRSGTCPVS